MRVEVVGVVRVEASRPVMIDGPIGDPRPVARFTLASQRWWCLPVEPAIEWKSVAGRLYRMGRGIAARGVKKAACTLDGGHKKLQ